MIEYVAAPTWSEWFETGKGTKTVSGTFQLTYGNDTVSVTTDRSPVRVKGVEYMMRANFRRTPAGKMVNAEYAPTIRKMRDYADPTSAVRSLIVEAARNFAETRWTADMAAAGKLASAAYKVRMAEFDVQEFQGKLATATDERDAAMAEYELALTNVPVGLRTGKATEV